MSKIGQEIIVRSRFFGKWKIATKGIYAKAMIVLFEQGGMIVASFPPLNATGYGDTAEEAIESLHVVIQEDIYAIPSTFKLAATFGMDWVLTEPPPVDPKYTYDVSVDFWFDRFKSETDSLLRKAASQIIQER